MKDRSEMTSINEHQALLPSFRLPDHHPHQHRQNKKLGGVDDAWRDLPSRGADINLLANTLTSRLRKAARQRVVTSSAGSPSTGTPASSAPRSAPPAEEGGRREERGRKSSKQEPPLPQGRPSILKRSLSREAAERQQRYLLEQSCISVSPRDDHHHYDDHLQHDHVHLPDVFLDRRLSASTGQLDQLHAETALFNNQYLDTTTPAIAFLGSAGGSGFRSTRGTANGEVVWVKRAGIFQPVDKYAPGRQCLHGADQPYARSLTVDYETVTLPSRAESPESDGLSGWSSGKSQRRKGLKVSWKPNVSGDHPDLADSRQGDAALSLRQRSAGTVHSDTGAFAFTKPKFSPGKTRIPVIGVQWKVPTPGPGKRQKDGGAGDGGPGSPTSGESSGHSSPASTQSLPPSLHHHHHHHPPGKPTSHTRDSRHPWRALQLPRDVHPVTTAMEREGTSVSKTRWHVPGVRRVPEYTFLEDVMESHSHQWNPAAPRPRHTTRATLDAQSLQARLRGEGGPPSGTSTTNTNTTTSTISNGTEDMDMMSAKRS